MKLWVLGPAFLAEPGIARRRADGIGLGFHVS